MQIAAGPVAIEVELQRKTAARLRGICWMYAQLSEDDEAPLNGVIYITDRHDVTRLVTRSAASVGLDSLSLRTLEDVIQQTRTAAGVPVVDEAVIGASCCGTVMPSTRDAAGLAGEDGSPTRR